MRYSLPRAVRDLAAPNLNTKLGQDWRKFATADFRAVIGYLGLALHRDLHRLRIEVARHRSECQKLEYDMRYAKSINADLGLRNCRLTERNELLEFRNRELKGTNHDLEQRNLNLEAENLRLKKQNHWLYYRTKGKGGPSASTLGTALLATRE